MVIFSGFVLCLKYEFLFSLEYEAKHHVRWHVPDDDDDDDDDG